MSDSIIVGIVCGLFSFLLGLWFKEGEVEREVALRKLWEEQCKKLIAIEIRDCLIEKT